MKCVTHRNWSRALLIFSVCFLIIPNFPFIRRWIINYKAKLCIIHQIPFKKFDREENIKSIEEDEFLVKCVGLLFSCCSLNWEVTPSIFDPYAMSLLQQRFDVTLKSPRTTAKKSYFWKLYHHLVQSFSQMFQSHLEAGVVNGIRQWSFTIFPDSHLKVKTLL